MESGIMDLWTGGVLSAAKDLQVPSGRSARHLQVVRRRRRTTFHVVAEVGPNRSVRTRVGMWPISTSRCATSSTIDVGPQT